MKEYKYDIFISYKHEELDKAVAAKLQKSLEHYKIPKEIQKKIGKKKIKRVFRDEEELAVSSDLGKEIEGQIAQSEYLLLVCSKKTKESQWVVKEIETFLKYRDAEHILPVLIEGEPEESFPESILTHGEPMAADVRGKNLKEVLKNVQRELPRLIAPVLNCSYDELKQRAKNYQIKRMLIGISVALIAVAGFAAYVVWQSAKLNKEYQKAQRNQARNMAQISEKLLEQGDRLGALKTALAVQPEDENSKEARVPEQMGALNNALYSYATGEFVQFYPIRAEYTEDTLIGKVTWNPDREYYAALDNAGYVYFFEGKTGKCIWKEFGDSLKPALDGFYAVTFIDDNTAALLSEDKIAIVNFKEKELNKIIKLQQKIENLSSLLSKISGEYEIIYNKDKIIVYGSESILAYDLKTGKRVFVIKKNDLKKGESWVINKVVCANENTILIGVSGWSGAGGGLFSYSTENKKITQISAEHTEDICVIDNKYIGVSQYKTKKYKYEMCIYNYHNGQKIWSKEAGTHIYEYNEYIGWFSAKMKVNKRLENVVMFYVEDTIYCVSLTDFKIINEKQCDIYIVGIEKFDDNRVLAGTEDGMIFLDVDAAKKKADRQIKLSIGKIELQGEDKITQFSYNKKSLTAIQVNKDAKMIVTSGMLKDTKMSKISGNTRSISKCRYFAVNKGGTTEKYRCVWSSSAGNTRLNIYRVGEKKSIYSMEYSAVKYLDNWMIGKKENDVLLFYTEDNIEKNRTIIHAINLKEKKEIAHYNIKAEPFIIVYSRDLSHIWYETNGSKTWETCISGIKLSEKMEGEKDRVLEEKTLSEDPLEKIYVSDNNEYIVIRYQGWKKDDFYYYLKIWDIKNEKWKKVDGEEKIQGIQVNSYNEPQSLVFGKKNQMAVCKENNTVEIIDLKKGVTQHRLSLNKKKSKEEKWKNSIAFLDNDKYLVVREEKNKISIWNIQKEKSIMQKEADMKSYEEDALIKTGNQYIAIESSEYKDGTMIFTVDGEHSCSLYADMESGWADLDSKEVIIKDYFGNLYLSRIYNFQELKKEALKILDGETLTKEEKQKYFLEE